MGDDLSFDMRGPEKAPLLLLLGSLGTTSAVWEPQLPTFQQWFRVVRLDYPGHGGAPVPAGRGSVEALGHIALAVLDRLQADTAHVAGLSIGGLVGLWLAAHHPARVGRLALCCTTARFARPEDYLARAESVRAQGTAPLVPAAISRWFTDAFRARDPEAVQRYSAMLAGIGREGYAFCCEAIAGSDLTSELGRVQAPTLVLGAAMDPVVPPATAAATMAAVPGSSLVVLPAGAHLVNVEEPRLFSDALLQHLAGSPSSRGEKQRRSVLGDAHVDRASAARTFGAPWQELLAKWPWGEIWARPGLDRRTRRLLAIAMLTTLGRSEELEMHMRAALRDGVSQVELREVLLQTAVYAGVPAANSAFAAAARALRAEGHGD